MNVLGIEGYDEITALGRELGLTCCQLDEIESYRSVGLTEMFWQMCRQYSTGQSDTCSVQNMMEALAKIGVNIEGKLPLQTKEYCWIKKKINSSELVSCASK